MAMLYPASKKARACKRLNIYMARDYIGSEVLYEKRSAVKNLCFIKKSATYVTDNVSILLSFFFRMFQALLV